MSDYTVTTPSRYTWSDMDRKDFITMYAEIFAYLYLLLSFNLAVQSDDLLYTL